MKRRVHRLDPFFRPKSIALFGSMQEGWFFGAAVIISDLLKWNYAGKIYPIHPTARTVYGIPVFQDLAQVKDIPELAVIVTSFRHAPGILEQCGAKGVRAAVIVSDGFGEAGPEGKIRQEELLRIAKAHGIRVMGPNTVGVFNSESWFTTIPYDRGYEYAKQGKLSIITQTGMYSPQAMAWHEYEAGINKVIDLGNMCDIDETDCLEYLGEDDSTDVISLYMEHSRRPRMLLDVLKKVSLRKPILCLLPGGSPGAAAAMAALSGSGNTKTSAIAPLRFSVTLCPRETASASSPFPGPSASNASMPPKPSAFLPDCFPRKAGGSLPPRAARWAATRSTSGRLPPRQAWESSTCTKSVSKSSPRMKTSTAFT